MDFRRAGGEKAGGGVEGRRGSGPATGDAEGPLPENAKPLSEILNAVKAQGYGPILEIELDKEGREIETVRGGETVELVADPETGEIRAEEAEELEAAEQEAEEQ